MPTPTLKYIDEDILRVYEFGKKKSKSTLLATLFWGDSVRVLGRSGDFTKLAFTQRKWDPKRRVYAWTDQVGAIPARTRFRDEPILKIRFVDVAQGDAAIIESPKGQLILVDGGEERHLYNYVSAAWAHVLRTRALDCAAIVVTHGDADHFTGLPILVSQNRGGKPMITAQRVFHNGLVKGSDKTPEKERFGKTVATGSGTYVVDLESDLLKVPEARMNRPFQGWKAALQELKKRNKELTIQRLEYGTAGAFDFLEDEHVRIDVLGPIVESVQGKPALKYLRTPGSSSLSASHTVNGHSVVLRLTYGNVRVLFGADLNQESEEQLLQRTRADHISLESEVLKVPHHGSADFSPAILEAIRPVVSVVSSGDENETKEYIHPRAGLVGALGKFSRSGVDKPLIYVTEMVAFFRRLGRISAHQFSKTDRDVEAADGTTINNGYSKEAFGIVHVRTDGERVLIATHSGKPGQKESYVFHVDDHGAVTFDEEPRIV
jgi:beta-lactamase superfamily II metal-dependent hydrolase